MSNTVHDLREVLNVGKPPNQVLWYRAMSRWIDGEPVKKSKGSLRMEGETIYHNTGGETQALRLGSDDDSGGLVLFRSSGLSEHYNPTHLQTAQDILRLTEGKVFIQGAYHWDQDPELRRTDEDSVWTWDIPRNLHLCIPVPGILLTLSSVRTMSPDLVDLGTQLEYARVQRIIKSRSKSIRKDGRVGYLTSHLMDSDYQKNRGVTLETMNTVRSLFGVDPLPDYESPIAGITLADYKNLHALVAC